jgi:hypothetical protein
MSKHDKPEDNREVPYTERVVPPRAYVRQLKLDPIEAMSSILNPLPNLDNPYTDNAEPILQKQRDDRALEMFAKSKQDNAEEQRASP